MARRGQRQSGATRTAPRDQRRARDLDNDGIIPVLARAVREVEAAAQRGRVQPSGRTKFQVVALLVREERARVKADADQQRGPARRAAQAPRRDRDDPGQDRRPRHLAARPARRGRRRLRRGQRRSSATCCGPPVSSRPPRRSSRPTEPWPPPPRPSAGSCRSRSSPASWPTPSSLPTSASAGTGASARPRRLASWELLGPLFRSFEYGGGPRRAWPCPSRRSLRAPGELELMHHQAQVVAAAAVGHRTLPARRRAGPGQDGPGAARRPGRERLPAARRRTERRQGQLGPRGRALDPRPPRHRDPRQR